MRVTSGVQDVERLYGGARGLLNADDAQLLNDASASVGGGGDGGGGVGGGGGGGGGGRGRGTAVGKGDDSIAAYAAWLDAPDGETPHRREAITGRKGEEARTRAHARTQTRTRARTRTRAHAHAHAPAQRARDAETVRSRSSPRGAREGPISFLALPCAAVRQL
eukprot:5801470-Pleurochrysis_carterae.AAC.1